MKKVIYMAMALLTTVLVASCSKEDVGGTATESMAGDWYVTVDAVDEQGNVVRTDDKLYNLGRFHLYTYNTPSNVPTEMIVDDQENFWTFKVKVNCDQQSLTFSANTTENNNLVAGYEDINVPIISGQILPKAGRQNNGSPADSIVFYVNFSDDLQEDGTPTPEALGFAMYRISGIRYSGLAEND